MAAKPQRQANRLVLTFSGRRRTAPAPGCIFPGAVYSEQPLNLILPCSCGTRLQVPTTAAGWAAICPRCQARVPVPPGARPLPTGTVVLAALGFGLIALAVAVALFLLVAPWVPGPWTDRPTGAASTAPDAVTAEQLAADYRSNAVAADQYYHNRIWTVTGTVQNVDQALFRGMVVRLEGGWGGPVSCFFGDPHRLPVAALRPGQTVHVRGRCRGKWVLGANLQDCELVSRPTR
jgi:hypothetical protein